MNRSLRCDWQTETGTINSPQVCGRAVDIGHSFCLQHERDAAETQKGSNGKVAPNLKTKGKRQ